MTSGTWQYCLFNYILRKYQQIVVQWNGATMVYVRIEYQKIAIPHGDFDLIVREHKKVQDIFVVQFFAKHT